MQKLRGPLALNGCAAAPSSLCFACGGPENDLVLYDASGGASSSPVVVWQAMNVPQDQLHLRVKVHVAALAFLPVEGPAKIVSGTGYK